MKKKMFKFISCIAILFMVSCSGDDLLFPMKMMLPQGDFRVELH